MSETTAVTSEERITCPSCGKQIEPVEVCYYCCAATDPKRRITEKQMVLWAVGVALVGIVLLALAGFHQTPVTPISELAADGAFLHYRVRGTVVRTSAVKTPYVDADVYSYWITDDASTDESKGVLKIKIEGPVYEKLKESKKVPRKGDRLDVEGTLYAGDGFRLLSLNSAAMLNIVSGEGE